MRLLDLCCSNCGLIFEDVWNDEVPAVCASCGSGSLNVVYLRAAAVDAREPFSVEGLGGPKFSSHREMEKYAKTYIDPATGEHSPKVILNKQEEASLKKHTTEDRLKKGRKALSEAFEKSRYRLNHGYVDHKPLAKETP